VIAAGLTGACYGVHRLGRRSGVTDAEVVADLPGDDLVHDPMWQSTRAITIDAQPVHVWPWVVQMGFPSHRAGWYTPYWLDHLTFGIKESSAEEIRPELQQLAVGDQVPDSDDWSVYFTVASIDPPHALVLRSTGHVIEPIRTVDFSWAFVLRDVPGGKTRLFIRARTNYTPLWAVVFTEFVIGPADYLNAGGMLRGIRRRVERPSRQRAKAALGCGGRQSYVGQAGTQDPERYRPDAGMRVDRRTDLFPHAAETEGSPWGGSHS
jgi:hypothetical protein